MNKKGALELSIGTIVIIVIGMSMLILGLVLVQKIFVGSTNNVDDLNNKIRNGGESEYCLVCHGRNGTK